MSSCHSHSSNKKSGSDNEEKADLTIALAGNANVGKSVIFNYFTGLHQHVGNWPGKTVERAEGSLHYKGYKIDIIDLPGIYSLSTFSIEELVSREYIAYEKPDVVINVVDACVLERNLFFTLQLIEMQVPLIIAVNMIDLAREKGIVIDEKKLSEILGVPVIPTIGIKGIGVNRLIEEAIRVAEGDLKAIPKKIEYGREIEDRIRKLEDYLKRIELPYPSRFIAIKLLEGDEEIREEIRRINEEIVEVAERYSKEIEEIHGEPCPVVISSERYAIASRIANETQKITPTKKTSLTDRIDNLITHKVLGYISMFLIMFFVFYSIFTFGDILSRIISGFFDALRPQNLGGYQEIFWEGAVGGFVAGVTLVLPYVLPFYFLLTILEDTGYLPRVAFMLDNLMHKIGLHGKAIIPMIMGYGCNVPACYSCRIMETQRDRLIAAFVITFIPCTARIIVILGLVATFVNVWWAFTLLLLDLIIILIMGRIAFKAIPGESMGLIMELHALRMPSPRVVITQTLSRLKTIIYIVFPSYIIGGVILAAMYSFNLLKPIETLLAPITVDWLRLPSIVSVLLLFGVVRKELVIIMPSILFGTTDLARIFTPTQMIVLSFITMIYIPCVATFTMLKREFGWKTALYITIFEILFAIALGGIFSRVIQFLFE